MATMARQVGQWTCLGTVERRDDVDAVRLRLGPDFELTAEPVEASLNAIGGHPWIRPRTTWEVWARATRAEA